MRAFTYANLLAKVEYRKKLKRTRLVKQCTGQTLRNKWNTMATIQLFLNVIIQKNDPGWYERLTSALKSYCATEQVEIVRQSEVREAQINISYELESASLNEIESIVINSGTSIVGVNIHLPTSVTGFADPYHASGVSLPLQERLEKIEGVLGGSISSNGEIKVELDAFANNKQLILEQILKVLPFRADNL